MEDNMPKNNVANWIANHLAKFYDCEPEEVDMNPEREVDSDEVEYLSTILIAEKGQTVSFMTTIGLTMQNLIEKFSKHF